MIGGLLKSTSTLAILAAAGLLIGGVTMAPKAARAADLGGDCCADLEERVAELEATTARKGNRKVSLTISGSITSAILFWDDGHSNDVNVINPDTTSEGFALDGSGKITSDMTAGFHLNFDARYGDPGDGTGLQDPYASSRAISHIAAVNEYVFISSKAIGTLSLGHKESTLKSANGGYDLGGDSGLNAYNGGIIDLAAGILIRDSAGGYHKGWYNALDNAGGGIDNQRSMEARYDSASFGGFTLSGSWGTTDSGPASALGGDEVYSVGVGYSGTFSGTSVTGGAAYQGVTNTINGTDTRWLAGASIYNAPSGIFLTGEYDGVTNNAATGTTSNNWFVKGGWRKNVNGLGETNVYGGYERSNDVAIVGVTGSGYFVGAAQALDSVASSLFLQYSHLSASDDAKGDLCGITKGVANGCSDEQSVVAGMTVRF